MAQAKTKKQQHSKYMHYAYTFIILFINIFMAGFEKKSASLIYENYRVKFYPPRTLFKNRPYARLAPCTTVTHSAKILQGSLEPRALQAWFLQALHLARPKGTILGGYYFTLSSGRSAKSHD